MDEFNPTRFSGRRLQKMRERAKMTQAKVSEKLGCSPVSYCNWERGKARPSADYICGLCRVLSCEVYDLYE